jgi:hypothetical protein
VRPSRNRHLSGTLLTLAVSMARAASQGSPTGDGHVARNAAFGYVGHPRADSGSIGARERPSNEGHERATPW